MNDYCLERYYFGDGTPYCGNDSCGHCFGGSYYDFEIPVDLESNININNTTRASWPQQISGTDEIVKLCHDLYQMGVYDCNCECGGDAFLDDHGICTGAFVVESLSAGDAGNYDLPYNNSPAVCQHIKSKIMGEGCLSSPGTVADASLCDTGLNGMGVSENTSDIPVCVNTETGKVGEPCGYYQGNSCQDSIDYYRDNSYTGSGYENGAKCSGMKCYCKVTDGLTGTFNSGLISDNASCLFDSDCEGKCDNWALCYTNCGGSDTCWNSNPTGGTDPESYGFNCGYGDNPNPVIACGDDEANNYNPSTTYNDCSLCDWPEMVDESLWDNDCLEDETCEYRTYWSEAHSSNQWDHGALYGGFNYDCDCELDRSSPELAGPWGEDDDRYGYYNCDTGDGACANNFGGQAYIPWGDDLTGWPYGRPKNMNWSAVSNWNDSKKPMKITAIKDIKIDVCLPDVGGDLGELMDDYCPDPTFQCVSEEIGELTELPWGGGITFSEHWPNDPIFQNGGDFYDFRNKTLCEVCNPDMNGSLCPNGNECGGGEVCVEWPKYAWLDIDNYQHCGCTGGDLEPDWCVGCAEVISPDTNRVALNWSPNALIHNYDCTYLSPPNVISTITGFRGGEHGPYFDDAWRYLNFEDRYHYFVYGDQYVVYEDEGVRWKASAELQYNTIDYTGNDDGSFFGSNPIYLSNPNSDEVCNYFTPLWEFYVSSGAVNQNEPNPFCQDPIYKFHWGATIVENGYWPAACEYKCGYNFDTCQNEGCTSFGNHTPDSWECGESGLDFKNFELPESLEEMNQMYVGGGELCDWNASDACTAIASDGISDGDWRRQLTFNAIDCPDCYGRTPGDGNGFWDDIPAGCNNVIPKKLNLYDNNEYYFKVFTTPSSGDRVECNEQTHYNLWEDDTLVFNPNISNQLNNATTTGTNFQVAIGLMTEKLPDSISGQGQSQAMMIYFHMGDIQYASGYNNLFTYASAPYQITGEHKSRPIVAPFGQNTDNYGYLTDLTPAGMREWMCAEPNYGGMWDCNNDALESWEGFCGDESVHQPFGVTQCGPLINGVNQFLYLNNMQSQQPGIETLSADWMGHNFIQANWPKLSQFYTWGSDMLDRFEGVKTIAKNYWLAETIEAPGNHENEVQPEISAGCISPVRTSEWVTMGDPEDHQTVVDGMDPLNFTRNGYPKLIGGVLQEWSAHPEPSAHFANGMQFPESYGMEGYFWPSYTPSSFTKGQCGRYHQTHSDYGEDIINNIYGNDDSEYKMEWYIKHAYYPESTFNRVMHQNDPNGWPYVTDKSFEEHPVRPSNDCTGGQSKTVKLEIHPDKYPQDLTWRIYKVADIEDQYAWYATGYQAGDYLDGEITSCDAAYFDDGTAWRCGSTTNPNEPGTGKVGWGCHRNNGGWAFLDWDGSNPRSMDECRRECQQAKGECVQWERTTGNCGCSLDPAGISTDYGTSDIAAVDCMEVTEDPCEIMYYDSVCPRLYNDPDEPIKPTFGYVDHCIDKWYPHQINHFGESCPNGFCDTQEDINNAMGEDLDGTIADMCHEAYGQHPGKMRHSYEYTLGPGYYDFVIFDSNCDGLNGYNGTCGDNWAGLEGLYFGEPGSYGIQTPGTFSPTYKGSFNRFGETYAGCDGCGWPDVYKCHVNCADGTDLNDECSTYGCDCCITGDNVGADTHCSQWLGEPVCNTDTGRWGWIKFGVIEPDTGEFHDDDSENTDNRIRFKGYSNEQTVLRNWIGGYNDDGKQADYGVGKAHQYCSFNHGNSDWANGCEMKIRFRIQ